MLHATQAVGVVVAVGFAVLAPVPAQPPPKCGPGINWVNGCTAGCDEINANGALVQIEIPPGSGNVQTLILHPDPVSPEPLLVGRSDPMQTSMVNPAIGSASPLVDDVMDTEIVNVNLVGGGARLLIGAEPNDPTLPPGPGLNCITPAMPNPPSPGLNRRTLGWIQQDPVNRDCAHSVFDVFFKIELPGLQLWNHAPLRLESVIKCAPPETTYIHLDGSGALLYTVEPGTPGTHVPVARVVAAVHGTGKPQMFGMFQKDTVPLTCAQTNPGMFVVPLGTTFLRDIVAFTPLGTPAAIDGAVHFRDGIGPIPGLPPFVTTMPALPAIGTVAEPDVEATLDASPTDASHVGCWVIRLTARDTATSATCDFDIGVLVPPECYLFLGLQEGYLPLGPEPDDVLRLFPLVTYPVTTISIPSLSIPNHASLVAMTVAAQVGMFNPVEFPSNPLQMSNGWRLTIAVGTNSFGQNSGIVLTGDPMPLLGHDYNFSFVIQ